MKITISEEAEIDFQDIYIYGFLNFGEAQARVYSENLNKIIITISENPQIGRLDTRIRPPIRRFETKRHVIFYDNDEDNLTIIRILHASVDFLRVF